MRICIVPNCERTYWSKGYCRRHDNQMRKYGKIIKTWLDSNSAIIEDDIAKIPIGVDAKHGYAIVDKEYAWLDQYRWNLNSGYAYSNKANLGKRTLMHRMITGAEPSQFIDHINGDKLDNRIVNLRIATNAENLRNRGKTKVNKSGYKGVYKRSDYGYRAEARYYGVKIDAGGASTAAEAAKNYDYLAKQLHGKYARLNFS